MNMWEEDKKEDKLTQASTEYSKGFLPFHCGFCISVVLLWRFLLKLGWKIWPSGDLGCGVQRLQPQDGVQSHGMVWVWRGIKVMPEEAAWDSLFYLLLIYYWFIYYYLLFLLLLLYICLFIYLLKGLQRIHIGQFMSPAEVTPNMGDGSWVFYTFTSVKCKSFLHFYKFVPFTSWD